MARGIAGVPALVDADIPAAIARDAEVTTAVAAEATARAAADALVGGWFKIGRVTAAASLDLASIPATYAHLVVKAVLRSDQNATFDGVKCSFNNDTTDANYDLQGLSAAATTAAAAQTLGAAGSRLPALSTAATGLANSFSYFNMEILDYAGSGLKMARCSSSYQLARTSGNTAILERVMVWASTAAINRITLAPNGGSNYVSGSYMDVYGLKSAA